MGYSYFGYIVENLVIYYVLWNKVYQLLDIILLVFVELQQVVWGENEIFLMLKDGSMLMVCQVFLLMGCYVCQFVLYCLVLVGDVVYIIYLLVGQGVNFGFMDVVELIVELKWLYCQGKDIGQYIYLCCYECSCKYSVVLMLVGMQGFCDLFFGINLVKKLLCDIGLKLVDMFFGVKL